MRMITNSDSKSVDAAEAVAHVANRSARNAEGGALEKVQARADAVEGMLGRLIGMLIANRALRSEQVSEIFDYDVIAE